MKLNIDSTLDPIGVAVSGGVDSMVLLYLAKRTFKNIFAINVEHGIRGGNSVSDSLFVSNYCLQEGISLLSYAVDALSFSAIKKISIESAARELRYNCFNKAISEKGLTAVLLAHHKDDQAETVLMRLFRGTGVSGLKGIVDNGYFLRPLISYTKKDLVEFADKNTIPYILDETNADTNYTRNYIRNVILPAVKVRYPGVTDSLARLSNNMQEVDDCLTSLATPPITKDGLVMLPLSAFLQHIAITKKSIANAVALSGLDVDFEDINLKDVLSLAAKNNGKHVMLPLGYVAYREYDFIVFCRDSDKIPLSLPLDSLTSFQYMGLDYTITKILTTQGEHNFDLQDILSKKQDIKNSDNWSTKISNLWDIDNLPSNLVLRNRQDGDVFIKFNGKKMLSKHLTDLKIPLRVRDRLIVLASGKDILAILDYDISPKIRATSHSTKLLHVTHN